MAVLYIVATPIGNLDDMTSRAVETLRDADVIAAEDTRHSKRLLDHFDIRTPLVACHEHNEETVASSLVDRIRAGENIALISDAGTPLVSDPGYRLIRMALDAGIDVVPIPGASAVLAALSVAGLPTDRFCFEGFLPGKQKQRQEKLRGLAREPRTIILFEAPHRIAGLLADIALAMGESREIVVARELTKKFEQVWRGLAGEAAASVGGEVVEKGEFVVMIRGAPDDGQDHDERELMEILLTELSPGTAASLASRILGVSRKRLYEVALSLKAARGE